MIIQDAILENSYWLPALSCVGLGLFVLLVIFIIFIKIFGNAIKTNIGIFIGLLIFFSGPLISFTVLFLVFCGFIPLIIDSKIIVEAPKQYKVEIIDKKIEVFEITTEKVKRKSHTKHGTRTYNDTRTHTKTRTLSETDISTNNITSSKVKKPDGTEVETRVSYIIFLKKWWESSDKSELGISVKKDTFDKLKSKQLVYIKSSKGCFGIRHLIKDNDFLKVVEENNMREATN